MKRREKPPGMENVKTNQEQLAELAALHSLGALDGVDAREFGQLLQHNPEAVRQAASFAAVAEALAKSLPAPPAPPPSLRERILQQAEQSSARGAAVGQLKQLAPAAGKDGLAFLLAAAGPGWLPLRVPGAFVKLLSFDDTSDHACVLGKLEAGARYPGHVHRHGEDVFMLSGDLHVGDQVLRAGDFHHASAGSTHGVNWSETGCVLLAVLSKEDLLDQLAPA